MKRDSKIYVAGHKGMAGSAIAGKLRSEGFGNLICRTRAELDLTRQADVEAFFDSERPERVFLAAAKVGGILANSAYQGDFISENLQIQTNVVNAAFKSGAKKLLFLGSSCIYPRKRSRENSIFRRNRSVREAGKKKFAGRERCSRTWRSKKPAAPAPI